MEIINKKTGEIVDGNSRFLVFQFTKAGLPVFLANRNRTPLTFTKDLNQSLQVYSRDHAIELIKRLKFGHLKVVTLSEAVLLAQKGAPEPVHWDKGLSMREE